MPKDIPLALKKITPYVRRAEELSRVKDNRTETVAFWCNKYAVTMGLALNQTTKTPEAKKLLGELLEELETMKKGGRVVLDEGEAKQLCEDFAMTVFLKADNADRAGKSDKTTAQTFYAASAYFDVLKQFNKVTNELDPELRQTALYSKWRASELLKAIKEGRDPAPPASSVDDIHFDDGEAGGDDEGGGGGGKEGEAAPTKNISTPLPPSPMPPAAPTGTTTMAVPKIPPHPQTKPALSSSGGVVVTPPPSSPAPTTFYNNSSTSSTPARANFPSPPTGAQRTTLTRTQKQDALEYIKFARAAVEAEEIELAVDKLRGALNLMYE